MSRDSYITLEISKDSVQDELPKALAKRSRKQKQVENLGLLATPFGQALSTLTLTCDDLCSLWSRSNLHARQSKFFTLWPPNPTVNATKIYIM